MSHQTPEPGPRRETGKDPAAPAGARRPLQRAGRWTREHWREARARLGRTHIPRPGRTAMTWSAAVLGLLAIAIAILIAVWDWNWFRGPLARAASARMHRQVTIDGDLRVHPFSWRPSATVDGVRIANPAWAGEGDLADIGRISLSIRLPPLLGGRLDLRLLRFDRPRVDLRRDAQGRASWDFSDGRNPGKPLRLPPIRDFVIDEGRLTLKDARRGLNFTGTINAAEQQGARNRGFELVGRGVLNAEPFTLRVTGGPLLNIDRDKPYPFRAEVRAGQTFVSANGAAPRPFDLGDVHMDATARGPDLADLYGVTGIPLPNTPPYDLRGRLTRDGQLWRLTGVTGRFGSSDVSGELSARMGKRPYVTAVLRSRTLNYHDAGALLGGGARPGKVASPQQIAAARRLRAEQRLLPDATLDLGKIRAIDADVTYTADSIREAPVNLRSGSARVRLDDGLLRVDPLAFELPQGRLAGAVQLNARPATPVTDLDLRLSNARLEQLVPVRPGGAPAFGGALLGRAKLRGAGASVHQAFANADGDLLLVVPGGEIRRAFAELLGVDVVKGLGLLLSKDQQSAPIRCGVAHFQAVDGVFRADRIVLDTGPVLVTGSGAVDMGSERLDLRVQGHPKKFRLVRVLAPVTAEGPLLHPKLGVEPGKALAQGGAAVALGAFLSPLAAILPFIDPGLAKDANCGALIAEAGQRRGSPQLAARR